jgi:hypothetical protein
MNARRFLAYFVASSTLFVLTSGLACTPESGPEEGCGMQTWPNTPAVKSSKTTTHRVETAAPSPILARMVAALLSMDRCRSATSTERTTGPERTLSSPSLQPALAPSPSMRCQGRSHPPCRLRRSPLSRQPGMIVRQRSQRRSQRRRILAKSATRNATSSGAWPCAAATTFAASLQTIPR